MTTSKKIAPKLISLTNIAYTNEKSKGLLWKTSRPFSDIRLIKTSDGEQYYDGYCVTPLGIVTIYHQTKWLTMRFVFNGHEYYRDVVGENYTPTGIAIMAGKFIREIAGKVNAYKVNGNNN